MLKGLTISTDDLGPLGSGMAEDIYWALWDAPAITLFSTPATTMRTTDALSVRGEWEENKHPRDPIGRFTSGGKGVTTSKSRGGAAFKPDDYLEAKRIEPVNSVTDPKKLEGLIERFREDGWNGRPILVIKGHHNGVQALTGSHRIYAAKKAGIEVPVVEVNPEILYHTDEEGRSIDDLSRYEDSALVHFLREFGDEKAAELVEIEIEEDGKGPFYNRDSWKEHEHPRDPAGKFSSGGGSGGKKAKPEAKKKAKAKKADPVETALSSLKAAGATTKSATPKYDPEPVETALKSLKNSKVMKSVARSVAKTEALREKTAAEQKKAASAAKKEMHAKAPHVGVELIRGGVETAWSAVEHLTPEEIKAAYKKSGLVDEHPREKDPQKMRANLLAAAVHQNGERSGAAEVKGASKMTAEEVKRKYGGGSPQVPSR